MPFVGMDDGDEFAVQKVRVQLKFGTAYSVGSQRLTQPCLNSSTQLGWTKLSPHGAPGVGMVP